MSQFKEGVDFGFIPDGDKGQVALADHFFVSKDGSDSGDGTINDPWLTVDYAFTQMTDNNKLVVGRGIYTPELGDPTINNVEVIGDGLVIFDGQSTNTFSSSTLRFIQVKNVRFINYVELFNRPAIIFKNCVFMNCTNTITNSSNNNANIINCKFINCPGIKSSNTIASSPVFDRCNFVNTTITGSDTGDLTITNSQIDSTSTVDFTNITGVFTSTNNNIQGTIVQTPDVDQDNINQNPLYNVIGDVNNLEFTVQDNSPLLGAGTNGSIIGGVSSGDVQNENSPDLNNTNAILTDVVINASGHYELDPPATTGTIESAVIDIGRKVRSPIFKLTLFTDFLNNVPDFDNGLVNPNFLDVEIRYALTEAAVTGETYQPFRHDQPIVTNTSGDGNATGTEGPPIVAFDWNDQQEVIFRYYQVRIIIRDNFNDK